MKGLSKNNVRIFFYELFIVAFGILIALAVDNLASEVPDRKKENEFLNSFLFELKGTRFGVMGLDKDIQWENILIQQLNQ